MDEYAPGVQRGLTDRAVGGLAAIAVGVIALRVTRRAGGSHDFWIYKTISEHFTDTGGFASDTEIVGRGIEGRYADFTPFNLRIYQALFAPGDFKSEQMLYVGYQMVVLWVGIALLVANRERLGLSLRALSLVMAGVVVCAWPVFTQYQDKAVFFTLTVAAVVAAHSKPWVFGLALGVLFGWAGLALLGLPLCLLRGTTRERVQAGVACGMAVVGLALCAGATAATTMYGNRLEREALDPFWYSVWRLLGDLYSPTLRNAVLAIVSALILWRAHRQRISIEAAVVAAVMLTLLVSNNGAATRFALVLPLGFFIFHSEIWSLAVAGWGLLLGLIVERWTTWLNDPYPAGLDGAVELVFVNAPLVVAVVWAVMSQRDVVLLQHPRLEDAPVAVGGNVAVVGADQEVGARGLR